MRNTQTDQPTNQLTNEPSNLPTDEPINQHIDKLQYTDQLYFVSFTPYLNNDAVARTPLKTTTFITTVFTL